MESNSHTNAQLNRLTTDQAWSLLLAAKNVVDTTPQASPCGLLFDEADEANPTLCDCSNSASVLVLDANHVWSYNTNLSREVKALLDLYLPFLSLKENGSMVIGHLGQSLDAQIATESGDAFFVTGPENRKHLHRMRALAQAVVVGVETVVTDNPQLTTRDVDGQHPVRVVLDPTARMPMDTGIATDGVAPTWVVQADDTHTPEGKEAEVLRIHVPLKNGRMQMAEIIAVLAEKGIRRIFVEGGGQTVTGMLTENCLDYFQLAAAPVFVGKGRPSVQLPSVLTMNSAFRPPYALYRMGADVLWSFDLRDIDASTSGIASRESYDAAVEKLPELERLL